MRLSWLAKWLPCAALLFSTASQADAGVLFDGKTLGYSYLYPNQSTSFYDQDITVGAGVEQSFLYPGGSHAFVDVSDTAIQVDYYTFAKWAKSPFNGFRIYDKYNILPAFTSATLTKSTGFSGLSQSNVTFDENNIYFNWQGQTANVHAQLSVDITAASPSRNGVVPEPASLAIFGVGGIGLAIGAMRSRKKATC